MNKSNSDYIDLGLVVLAFPFWGPLWLIGWTVATVIESCESCSKAVLREIDEMSAKRARRLK